MAYTTETNSKKTITWNDNPNGTLSYAVVLDSQITELVVQNAQGINIVYSLNQTELEHLKTVITNLLAEIAAP